MPPGISCPSRLPVGWVPCSERSPEVGSSRSQAVSPEGTLPVPSFHGGGGLWHPQDRVALSLAGCWGPLRACQPGSEGTEFPEPCGGSGHPGYLSWWRAVPIQLRQL